MVDVDRRGFLKTLGAAGATAVFSSCQVSHLDMVPAVRAREDIIPGEATWFATTCRECPARCGIWAKNRDGHVIKAEGNGNHPVNAGKLCPRGQASLHGLYNLNPVLKFLGYFWGPIPCMIEVAAILSGVVRHWVDLDIIIFLLIFNSVVGFWEEHEAGNALEALKKQLAMQARTGLP